MRTSNTHAVIIALLTSAIGCQTINHSIKTRIADSIEQAVTAESQEQQQAEFNKIVALGCSAVPTLVSALGDSRRLPFRYLVLENAPVGSIEAFRQYGPETVTDALAAILNHLTWEQFGFIYNGASQEEREQAISGWQGYLKGTPTGELCPRYRGGV